MKLRSGIYIVPTHRWYIERTVWLIAGFVLLASTTLAALVHPLWILLVVATALASITVALTGFCIVGNVLYRLGFTPMLGRTAPTRPEFYFMQTDRWYLERRIYLVVGINLTVASVLSVVHSPWWLTFLYNSSGGSVLMAILWHIVWNVVNVVGAALSSDLVVVMNVLVIPLGLVALVVGGPRKLSWPEKHVIEPMRPAQVSL